MGGQMGKYFSIHFYRSKTILKRTDFLGDQKISLGLKISEQKWASGLKVKYEVN